MNPRSSSSTLPSLKTLLVTACALAGLSASSLWADTVYFSSTTGAGSYPTGARAGYSDVGMQAANSSTHTTAAGNIGSYTRYKTCAALATTTATISWAGDAAGSVKPGTPYGVYTLYSAMAVPTYEPTMSYTIAAVSGCRYDSTGADATAFRANGNSWRQNGLIIVDGNTPVTTPVFTYTFTYTAGNGSARLYIDNFQLSLLGQAVHISTSRPPPPRWLQITAARSAR